MQLTEREGATIGSNENRLVLVLGELGEDKLVDWALGNRHVRQTALENLRHC